MLASYILSRTLVPTLSKYWLKKHDPDAHANARGALARFQVGFERRFESLRENYHGLLERALHSGLPFVAVFLLVMASTAIWPSPGQVHAGTGTGFLPHRRRRPDQDALARPHRHAHRGNGRAVRCGENMVRQTIPAAELGSVVDNIGLPYSGINTAYSTSAAVGPGDADVFITLNEGHSPTAGYVRTLRTKLAESFPSTSFAFLPADIVSQILNFGLPSPLDIQISGFNVNANRDYPTPC